MNKFEENQIEEGSVSFIVRLIELKTKDIIN